MMKLPTKPIPFELITGIALIPGEIGAAAGYFALDTGATQTVLNKAYCGAANTAAEEAITFDRGAQSSEIASCDAIRLTLAGEEIKMESPLIMDMTYVETPLRKERPGLVFLGSVGADILGTGRLIVDYLHRQALLGACRLPGGAKVGKSVPLSFAEGLPIAELEIRGVPYRFVLDTGANHFVMDQSAAPMDIICDSSDKDAPHCIPSLFFAGMEYRGVTGMVTDLSAVRNALHVDGIIGYPLLKGHICCFDYEGKRLYLMRD